MKKFLILIHVIVALSVQSATLHVGSGQPYTTLNQATSAAQPGDTVLVHQGTYAGGISVQNLQGTSGNKWIYIHTAPGETVIYNGGGNAWQFSDGAFLHIKGFIFQQQTGNGLNMDDGGTYATPSHHLVFDSCTFRDINATGNNDLLKMSGIDTFEIRNCTFLNGSIGAGDAIDMVGCHEGLIKNCRFENMGAASIQAKGGCKNIRIEGNFFKNGGQRAINLGGSTGLQFFRPIDAKYEASDLKVYSNIFIGSDAPVAYVGCVATEVVNNTIYLPKKWVLRILQERVDTARFYPCGNNTFRNNIVWHDNLVTTDCNIGPNTDPGSFTFSNNLWYHSQNAGWTGPVLPAADANSIVGQNPLFTNAALENFMLLSNSPAIAQGFTVANPANDYDGSPFAAPRSIGAFEGNSATQIFNFPELPAENVLIFQDLFTGAVRISLPEYLRNHIAFSITEMTGKTIFYSACTACSEQELFYPVKIPQGIYLFSVTWNGRLMAVKKLFF